jgi:hypothetical protein
MDEIEIGQQVWLRAGRGYFMGVVSALLGRRAQIAVTHTRKGHPPRQVVHTRALLLLTTTPPAPRTKTETSPQ